MTIYIITGYTFGAHCSSGPCALGNLCLWSILLSVACGPLYIG
jgi:hypothetical protein